MARSLIQYATDIWLMAPVRRAERDVARAALIGPRGDPLDTLRADLHQAFRALRASRAFTGVAILTLALGIGASVTLFSVVDGVLLRPLPYPDAERLMVTRLSLPDFDDVVARSRAFEDAAVWASNVYDVSFGADAESVLGAVVSPRFFPLLGQATLGRTFRPEEDGEPLAVISYALWQRRFGGSADVLGRRIDLADRAHTIVGVMPLEFEYPGRRFEVWSTLGSAMSRTPEQLQNRSLRIFRAVLKRKPGLTAGAAQAEVTAIATNLAREYPQTNTSIEIELTPLSERLLGDVRGALLALLGAAGFVLLIACANVAHLALARTSARGREIAVRRALGASDPRLARQFLTEGLVLALLGAAAGVLLATWAVEALRRLEPAGLPRVSQVRIDGTVLLFSLAASVGTAVLVSLAPMLAATRARLVSALGDGARSTPASGGRFRQALVVGELALSLVVIAGAGLLARSFHRLVTVDPGFTQENLVTLNVGLWRYEEADRRIAVLDAVLERLRALPGVEAVGSGTGLPPENAQRGTSFEVRERSQPQEGGRRAYFLAVTPDYFRALGTPVVEGRPIEARDGQHAAKVVVLNRSLARRLFGDESALGKHVRLLNPDQSPDWREVVGVVADVRYSGLDDPGEAAIYTPFAQTPFIFSYPMVRTRLSPKAAVEPIRQALGLVDLRLAAARIAPMSDLVRGSVAQPRFNLLLLSAFAVLALVLSAVGTYGVIAYGVVQRTREIGVRVALGAERSSVLWLVLREVTVLALAGVAIGLPSGYGLGRLVEAELFGLTARDPLTYAVATTTLLLAAFLAGYIPAMRATRVDPMVALRYE